MKKQKHRDTPRTLTFGEVVQYLRDRQGLSTVELAELVELPHERILGLETGLYSLEVDRDLAHRFAAALDVDPRMVEVALPRGAQ